MSKPRDSALRRKAACRSPWPYVWEEELLEVLPGLRGPKYEPIKAIYFHTRITSKFYGECYAGEE